MGERRKAPRGRQLSSATSVNATSGKHGREQKWLASNFASTHDATGVACIVATMTTTAVIATIAIATASEVHEAPTNATDATDATDVEVATISRMANATRKRREGDDSQANAPEMAQRRRKRGRDFARQGRRRLSDGPARQASEEEATLVAPRAQEAQDNDIESDDDVDVNDVNDDDLPAELGECSMGNDGFDSPPGLQLTGHTSRAGGDEETLVELSLKIKKD